MNMGKKKKSYRRKVSALSPINKQGIKLGTLLAEMGLVVAGVNVVDEFKSGNAELGAKKFADSLSPSYTPGKLLWTGVGIALIGKLTGFRRFGPIQLS
jgi:hypothetical protein